MTTSIQKFDFSINVMRSQLWQYDHAENMTKILSHLNEWMVENSGLFWESWLVDVFDLRTANEFGLSVWSSILNVPLFSNQETSPASYNAFGFAAYGTAFDQGNFATDSPFYNLTVEEKRIVLRFKAFKCLSAPSITDTNKFMGSIFGKKKAYVHTDNSKPMECVYSFSKALNLSIRLFQALTNLDLLPTPAAVKASISVFTPLEDKIHFSNSGNTQG